MAAATPSRIMILMLLVYLAEVFLVVIRFLAFYFIPRLLATVVTLAIARAKIVLVCFFNVEVRFLSEF